MVQVLLYVRFIHPFSFYDYIMKGLSALYC